MNNRKRGLGIIMRNASGDIMVVAYKVVEVEWDVQTTEAVQWSLD